MKMRLQSALGALGLVLLLAQSATAQIERTVVGKITATIDGTPYVGETLVVPSEGTSTAEFQAYGPITLISVQGHDPRAESIMHNVLSVEVSLMGNGAAASITDATISWWPEGMTTPFYNTEASANETQVTLDGLSLEGVAPSVQGSFASLICRKDSFIAAPDSSDCLQVEGKFETMLESRDY